MPHRIYSPIADPCMSDLVTCCILRTPKIKQQPALLDIALVVVRNRSAFSMAMSSCHNSVLDTSVVGEYGLDVEVYRGGCVGDGESEVRQGVCHRSARFVGASLDSGRCREDDHSEEKADNGCKQHPDRWVLVRSDRN